MSNSLRRALLVFSPSATNRAPLPTQSSSRPRRIIRHLLIVPVALLAAFAGGATRALQDTCGPFTDVSALFCPYVLEAYYTGITAGTSPTTFSPDVPITRGQAAVFVTKGLNQALARGSRHGALGQWWTTTPHWDLGLGATAAPGWYGIAGDGADIWVTGGGEVKRVRASDGRLLETWTGAPEGYGLLVAMGRVFVAGGSPGKLYMIDPSQPAGAVTLVADALGAFPEGIAFDGSRIWTANEGGSVSIVTPGASPPWSVVSVTTGFHTPVGILFDGASMWVTDPANEGLLLRLDSNAAIVASLHLGPGISFPTFDGTNLWVPNYGASSVQIVNVQSGALVRELTGNGLNGPNAAAFDGERVLVTSSTGPVNSGVVSLWRAADLSPLGFTTAPNPRGVCSDGLNFWIALAGSGQLARF